MHWVVASDWSVPDQETAEIMRAFYANLVEGGLPVPEALWRAKLSLPPGAREFPITYAAFAASARDLPAVVTRPLQGDKT